MMACMVGCTIAFVIKYIGVYIKFEQLQNGALVATKRRFMDWRFAGYRMQAVSIEFVLLALVEGSCHEFGVMLADGSMVELGKLLLLIGRLKRWPLLTFFVHAILQVISK